ncbi:BTAD domain-containing putative transcriptional regulator [Streptomyces acidicola]|uniref:BTAD domain-containing putative transcriptional regulator n=1 Tax=Streptomyces acidicola TaxID=2596892 RepID=UPI003418A46B
MGPLEVHTGSKPVELGGTRQRATLAFLLLHANRVVPTSHLLDALWPAEHAPATARKILQNAVWRLRRALADAADPADSHAPELVTRAPGYVLRVRPEQVDLLVFQQQVAAGRAALAAGDPLTACRTLGDALSLWRGVALADLVEDGTAWPQLTAVQDKRLDVMEDRFEAELACGGHHTVLRELEAFVEAEPLRERASRLLMTALYRCGRQAEALNAYHRLRTALVEGLGLEPEHRTRLLQQSVLTQDPSLDLDLPSRPDHFRAAPDGVPASVTAPPDAVADGTDTATVPGGAVTAAVVPATGRYPAVGPGLVPAVVGGPETTATAGDGGDLAIVTAPGSVSSSVAGADTVPGADAEPDSGRPEVTATDDVPRRPNVPAKPLTPRQPGSVLMFRFRLGAELDRLPPQDIDRVLDAVSRLAREKIEDLGGRAASLGSVQLGFFADAAWLGDGAEPAVRAAVAVRNRLSAPAHPLAPSADPVPSVPGLHVHTVVTTGEAVVTEVTVSGTVRPLIGGDPVETCQEVLEGTPAHEIRVCDRTRRLTEGWVTYHPVPASPSSWRLGTDGHVTTGSTETVPAPPGGHGGELELMRSLLRRTRDLRVPHLATVLDPSGSCATRLLTEFRDGIAAEEGDVRVLSATVPRPGPGGPLAAPAEMFAAYCGATDRDTPGTALRKAEDALLRLTGREEGVRPMLTLLRPLLTAGSETYDAVGVRRTLLAWRDFVVRAACAQPLVLVWNGLHRADDMVLDTVEQLTEHRACVPLLNVVGTHPLLVERRPDWAGGRRHAMTVSLAPTGPDALERLLASLPVPVPGESAEVA